MQEADLDGQHLKYVFLEEDEVKPVVNPTYPSIVFPRPRRFGARATLDAPPAPPLVIPPPATSSIAGMSSPSFSLSKILLPML